VQTDPAAQGGITRPAAHVCQRAVLLPGSCGRQSRHIDGSCHGVVTVDGLFELHRWDRPGFAVQAAILNRSMCAAGASRGRSGSSKKTWAGTLCRASRVRDARGEHSPTPPD
jgi:hypothetical protein